MLGWGKDQRYQATQEHTQALMVTSESQVTTFLFSAPRLSPGLDTRDTPPSEPRLPLSLITAERGSQYQAS